MINAGMVFLTGTMVGLTTQKAAWVKLRETGGGLEKPRADSVPMLDENYHRK